MSHEAYNTRRSEMNEGKLSAGCEVTQRQSVAEEVAQQTQRVANRAQQLAELVNVRLHPVMTSDMPRPCEPNEKAQKEYPPLFSDLRSNLKSINEALDAIEYAMSRTEL